MSGVTVHERSHRSRAESPVTNLPGAPTAGSLSYSFQELNKSMVDNYLKPVFLQTPGNNLRLIGQEKNFYFQGTVLWQKQLL